jgi:hypothetical protein
MAIPNTLAYYRRVKRFYSIRHAGVKIKSCSEKNIFFSFIFVKKLYFLTRPEGFEPLTSLIAPFRSDWHCAISPIDMSSKAISSTAELL